MVRPGVRTGGATPTGCLPTVYQIGEVSDAVSLSARSARENWWLSAAAEARVGLASTSDAAVGIGRSTSRTRHRGVGGRSGRTHSTASKRPGTIGSRCSVGSSGVNGQTRDRSRSGSTQGVGRLHDQSVSHYRVDSAAHTHSRDRFHPLEAENDKAKAELFSAPLSRSKSFRTSCTRRLNSRRRDASTRCTTRSTVRISVGTAGGGRPQQRGARSGRREHRLYRARRHRGGRDVSGRFGHRIEERHLPAAAGAAGDHTQSGGGERRARPLSSLARSSPPGAPGIGLGHLHPRGRSDRLLPSMAVSGAEIAAISAGAAVLGGSVMWSPACPRPG